MTEDAATLPDLLTDGLDVVFVGINPSLYSVAQGHYFARRANRFWPAFSRSCLSLPARLGLAVEQLEPRHDQLLPQFGFGFTDLAKRASARAETLTPAEMAEGAVLLSEKLRSFKPRAACLHGITVARPLARLLAADAPPPRLGRLSFTIGSTILFAVPNPSPANAHFTPADQTGWYDTLAGLLAR